MPLHPSWWRNRKYDKCLNAAYKKFTEALVKDPSARVPCIWHEREHRAESEAPPSTSCGFFCSSEADLYNHNCLSRTGKGGDIYQLKREIGDAFYPANRDLDTPIYDPYAVSQQPPSPLFKTQDWGFFNGDNLRRQQDASARGEEDDEEEEQEEQEELGD
jgi:hypothetical protein